MDLPFDLLALLRRPRTCCLAITMPDGSPQLTQTWVDTDGSQVVINTVQRVPKAKNVERDSRVAVTVSDPANPPRYDAVRGRVVGTTTDGGAEHMDALAQRYLGLPCCSRRSAARCSPPGRGCSSCVACPAGEHG